MNLITNSIDQSSDSYGTFGQFIVYIKFPYIHFFSLDTKFVKIGKMRSSRFFAILKVFYSKQYQI